MHKPSKNFLLQTVLASTLFVAQSAQAVIITDTNVPPPSNGNTYLTSLDGNVFIAPSGQVLPVGANDGIDINTNGGFVVIEPSNKHDALNGVQGASAIEVTGTGNGIATILGSKNAHITLGTASGITLNAGGASTASAIHIATPGTVINNAGTLQLINANNTGPVIDVALGGDNTVIINEKGGVIAVTGGKTFTATILVETKVEDFRLTNNGQIIQTTEPVQGKFVADTILIDGGKFNAITNQSNGLIIQTDKLNPFNDGGHAIEILNTGKSGGGGAIINEKGGIITTAAGADTIFISTPVITDMEIGNINNAGTISNTSKGFIGPAGNALTLEANAGATLTVASIINSGTFSSIIPRATISTSGLGTVIIEGGLQNSGDIIAGTGFFANGGPGVAIGFASPTSRVTIFQSDGNIGGSVFLASRAPTLGNPVLVMTGGKITGNVIAQSVHRNTFNVSGGDLAGTLFFGTEGDTLNLSGGNIFTIQGNTLGVDQDTINISGGSFEVLNTSLTGGSTTNININDTFTQDGTIFGAGSTLNITTKNTGTIYTLNGAIYDATVNGQGGLNGVFTVSEGTTIMPNNFIAFDGPPGSGLLNHGTVWFTDHAVFNMPNGATFFSDPAVVVLGAGSVTTIAGDATPNVFEMGVGSVLVEQINGFCPPGGFFESGLLIVDSNVAGTSAVKLDKGSFIVPQVTGVLFDGAAIPVIEVIDGNPIPPGGFINDNSTLVQPASATISFSKEIFDLTLPLQGQVLTLIAHRTPFVDLADGPEIGVATALDEMMAEGICNNDLCTLIAEFDQIATVEAVDDALATLTPPDNYGLIAASHIGVDSMFEGITDRVWDVAWHHRDHGRRHSGRPKRAVTTQSTSKTTTETTTETKTETTTEITTPASYRFTKDGGVSFGDLYKTAGIWLRPIFAYVDQSGDDGVEGYRARAWGGAIGADWGVTDCTTFGAAISFTHVNVDDKAFAGKDEAVEAWMGTLYGSFDFRCGVFFDAMFAGAHNDYDINRVIAVNELLTAAQSSFDGTTWAAQADLGWALPQAKFFLAPFARLKWVHVDFDDFTETGASDLDLSVSIDDANEFLGGLGIRMAGDVVFADVEWVPELMAMIGYDFTLDGEDSIASFIDCGPAFATDGVTPGRTVFDLGLALNAMILPCAVVTAKYNLEIRDDFVSNAAYLQYFYNWS